MRAHRGEGNVRFNNHLDGVLDRWDRMIFALPPRGAPGYEAAKALFDAVDKDARVLALRLDYYYQHKKHLRTWGRRAWMRFKKRNNL